MSESPRPNNATLEFTLPRKPPPAGGKQPATASQRPAMAERIPRIAKLLALAIQFEGRLQQGQVNHCAAIARAGHVSRARLSQLMSLLDRSMRRTLQKLGRFLLSGEAQSGRRCRRSLRSRLGTPTPSNVGTAGKGSQPGEQRDGASHHAPNFRLSSRKGVGLWCPQHGDETGDQSVPESRRSRQSSAEHNRGVVEDLEPASRGLEVGRDRPTSVSSGESVRHDGRCHAEAKLTGRATLLTKRRSRGEKLRA